MAIVFKGRVFSVEVETVRLPNGRAHEMAIVRHPPSVVLIPMTDAGHVILVRQYRHSVRRDLWELPAGSLDPGESADAAAKRECEEEIGLVPHRVDTLGSLYPTPGYCDEEMIFFRVSAGFTAQAGRGRGHLRADVHDRGGESDGRARRDHRSQERLRLDAYLAFESRLGDQLQGERLGLAVAERERRGAIADLFEEVGIARLARLDVLERGG